MTKLKYEDAFVVDCFDLDKFVAEIMKERGHSVTWRSLDTGYDGYHNGSFEEADVSFGAEIENDLDQDFIRWLSCHGPFYLDEEDAYSLTLPGIENMLQWLCNIGSIPDGKYVVKLWW